MLIDCTLMDLDTRILIVDDDDGIRTLISEFLGKHGYVTTTASNPIEMRALLAKEHYDLVVLDVMMPKEDGLTALRKLGADAPPVIMLSAVGGDIDRIIGLEMGADDYLAKPCNPRELLARIRTVLRRYGKGEAAETEAAPLDSSQATNDAGSGDCLHFAGWRMDLGMRLLFDPVNNLITLSDGEFRLLRAFAEHARRVVTRDQLLNWSRGDDTNNFDRAIDVQLSRLRRKLGDGQDIIRTVRNEGYLFVPLVSR
jgi:two-component system OmpR family response regulator